MEWATEINEDQNNLRKIVKGNSSQMLTREKGDEEGMEVLIHVKKQYLDFFCKCARQSKHHSDLAWV